MSETSDEEVAAADALATDRKPTEPGAKPAPSPALARLIEEVRNEKPESPNAYNRTHNRHNRSR